MSMILTVFLCRRGRGKRRQTSVPGVSCLVTRRLHASNPCRDNFNDRSFVVI